ncbi:aminotransferase class V-fold PLP-dependent enzyme [bacterium SCSIO 12741]|nr:aminotransferase class V-fold PLP-dependent enzyme [bacterium SCSIO 12741]
MQNTDLIYLDTAACGLIHLDGLQAQQAFMQNAVTDASGVANAWRDKTYFELRNTARRFLDCTEEELAFIPNFSYGLFSFIQAIKGKHKRVLLFQNDYPSLTLPFELNGFEITSFVPQDFFEVDYGALEKMLIQQKIELVAVSHVQYLNGARVDLELLGNLCQRLGILLVVDATQSLGADALSFRELNVDVLIASNYKWMNGGFGTGVMCCKPHITKEYLPQIGGFGSYQMGKNGWEFNRNIRSYEPGHPAIGSLLLLHHAMEYKISKGMESIRTNNRVMLEKLISVVNKYELPLIGPSGVDNRLGIACCSISEEMYQYLHQNQVRCTFRNGHIRLSVHHTNSLEDLDRFDQILAKAPKSALLH